VSAQKSDRNDRGEKDRSAYANPSRLSRSKRVELELKLEQEHQVEP
jgi:hypothetical protein